MPEIVVDGDTSVRLEDALVLDHVADVERLREAHERGTPVVVRANDADAVLAALKRPEVACALVPRERADLRELDLRRMTYGGASSGHGAPLPGVADEARQETGSSDAGRREGD